MTLEKVVSTTSFLCCVLCVACPRGCGDAGGRWGGTQQTTHTTQQFQREKTGAGARCTCVRRQPPRIEDLAGLDRHLNHPSGARRRSCLVSRHLPPAWLHLAATDSSSGQRTATIKHRRCRARCQPHVHVHVSCHPGSTQLSDWVEDCENAFEEVASLVASDSELVLLTARLSSTVAARIENRFRKHIAWDPIVEGKDWLEDMASIRRVQNEMFGISQDALSSVYQGCWLMDC